MISRGVPLNDMTESGGLDVKELGRWALRIALLGALVFLYVDRAVETTTLIGGV